MKRLIFLLIPLLFCSTSPPIEQPMHVYRYLNLIENDATTISNMFGIPKALIIAQSCQETGFGTSFICNHYCNFFGIKNGFYDSQFECFLRYAEILVSSKCYRNLQPKTLDDWFSALDCCHYAGDVDYTKRLKQIIEKYNL